jgi:hypothetical protein
MQDKHVSIDLHWHVHYSDEYRRSFAIEPEAMIERHRVVNVAGTPTPTLDPVDTLLMLAFHAARSNGHRLIWMKDIERSVAIESPDLSELVARARAARCAPPVGLMLQRARLLLDAEVERATIDELIPPSLRCVDRVTNWLSPPVRVQGHATLNELVMRSMRSSASATALQIPTRAVQSLRRRLFPPVPNETDNEDEKQRYLDAVLATYR